MRSESQPRFARVISWPTLLLLLLLLLLGIAALILLILLTAWAASDRACNDCDWTCSSPNPCEVPLSTCGNCRLEFKPNGALCNSTCYYPQCIFDDPSECVNGTSEETVLNSHQCSIKSKDCIECQGTVCRGQCSNTTECDAFGQPSPLINGYGNVTCVEGMCVYNQTYQGESGTQFPCSEFQIQQQCKKYVKPEYMDCMVISGTCNIEIPVLERDAPTTTGKDIVARSSGFAISECRYMFACSQPIPAPPQTRDIYLDYPYEYDDTDDVVRETKTYRRKPTTQSVRKSEVKKRTNEVNNNENRIDNDKDDKLNYLMSMHDKLKKYKKT